MRKHCLAGYKLLVLAVIIGTSLASHASAQTLLAGYDFQTTTNGGTAAAVAPNAPSSYMASFGTQAGSAGLYLNGTNGSSSFVTTTTGNEITAFAGTAVNAGSGFSTTTTSPAAIAVVGGTASGSTFTANGKTMVFTFSTTGYQNLILTFATQRTSTGFTGNTVSYSLDGTTFTPFATVAPATAYATVTEDFSAITALNNATTVYIGYTFAGATSASGNNRFDNIQFNATAVPEPATLLGGALLVGALGWKQRRRVGGWMAKARRRSTLALTA